MKGDTPLIEYAEKPARLKLVPLPDEGIVVLYRDGHEEYLRSCPGCGHRMEVSSRWGGLPQWYCPVANDGGSCGNTQREPVARMTVALAKDFSEVRSPEKCHVCGGEDLVVEILRRLNRVEIMVRHRAGHKCEAETIYILQTYHSPEFQKQEWEKHKKESIEEALKKLPVWDREEAARKVKESGDKS